jgi:hypothetical protein
VVQLAEPGRSCRLRSTRRRGWVSFALLERFRTSQIWPSPLSIDGPVADGMICSFVPERSDDENLQQGSRRDCLYGRDQGCEGSTVRRHHFQIFRVDWLVGLNHPAIDLRYDRLVDIDDEAVRTGFDDAAPRLAIDERAPDELDDRRIAEQISRLIDRDDRAETRRVARPAERELLDSKFSPYEFTPSIVIQVAGSLPSRPKGRGRA